MFFYTVHYSFYFNPWIYILFSLLTKKRKSKEIEYPPFEYKWKQFESDVLIDNNIALSYDQYSTFRIHPGISLKSGN